LAKLDLSDKVPNSAKPKTGNFVKPKKLQRSGIWYLQKYEIHFSYGSFCRLIFLALFPVAVFASCSRVDYVKIAGGETGEHSTQSVFIKSLFGENLEIVARKLRLLGKTDEERKGPKTSLTIEMLSLWEHEGTFGDICRGF
jgi:hypothetical protein